MQKEQKNSLTQQHLSRFNVKDRMRMVDREKQKKVDAGRFIIDSSMFGNFQDMMFEIRRAEQEFYRLPANIRRRFNNDIYNMIDFINDPGNREEAEKLGFIEKKDKKRKINLTAGEDGKLEISEDIDE